MTDFDIVAFSIGYEMAYTTILEYAGSCRHTYQEQLTEAKRHPLVIAGGTCCYNAEPIADFIDLFILGEGEEVDARSCGAVTDNAVRDGYCQKKSFLIKAAKIGGVYVPSLYDVEYNDDGTVKDHIRRNAGAPERIKKRHNQRF